MVKKSANVVCQWQIDNKALVEGQGRNKKSCPSTSEPTKDARLDLVFKLLYLKPSLIVETYIESRRVILCEAVCSR